MVRIPAGATNIDVRQHSYSGKPEDDNYLGELQSLFKSRNLLYCLVVAMSTGCSLLGRMKNSLKGGVFLLRLDLIYLPNMQPYLVPSFFHAILDAKFGRFTDSKKYPLRVSLGLGRTLEPVLWVGAEALSWDPNRLLSSAGVFSSQLNTTLHSLCLSWRVNVP